MTVITGLKAPESPTHCNRVQYMYSKVLSQSTLTLAQSPTLFVIFHNI